MLFVTPATEIRRGEDHQIIGWEPRTTSGNNTGYHCLRRNSQKGIHQSTLIKTQ